MPRNAHEGLTEERLIVIHNGVDCARFDVAPDPAAPGLAWCRLGRGRSSRWLRTSAASKGHAVFLQAWASVVRALPRSRALLVGGGPLHDELQDRAAALGVRELGPLPRRAARRAGAARPDGRRRARLADREASPNAVLEALAAGRPVVATDAGGTREAIIDGRTGLLVPPGDAGALEAGLVRLLSNPDRGAGPGQGGATARRRALPDLDDDPRPRGRLRSRSG